MINLYPDEKVMMTIRRHWFVIFSQSLVVSILALVPLIIFFSFGDFLKIFLTNNLFLFFYTLWLLYLWIYFSIIFLEYYLDVWIITNKRLIALQQISLFNREISEFPLEKIQDITVEINGVIETFLNFGDIIVETAGEEKELEFRQIPNPEESKNLIWEQYHAATPQQKY